MAHTRQSRPESGLGFQVKARKTLQVVPSAHRTRNLSLSSVDGTYLGQGDIAIFESLDVMKHALLLPDPFDA
jgi:hypothetical protein